VRDPRDARPDGDAEQPVTAQELFKHVMRDLVGPGLRELGFVGGYTRGFRIVRGDYAGFVDTQKSVGSIRTEVWFWVHLSAGHVPTQARYWDPPCRVISRKRDRSFARLALAEVQASAPAACPATCASVSAAAH
jgi:hypothetical protein